MLLMGVFMPMDVTGSQGSTPVPGGSDAPSLSAQRRRSATSTGRGVRDLTGVPLDGVRERASSVGSATLNGLAPYKPPGLDVDHPGGTPDPDVVDDAVEIELVRKDALGGGAPTGGASGSSGVGDVRVRRTDKQPEVTILADGLIQCNGRTYKITIDDGHGNDIAHTVSPERLREATEAFVANIQNEPDFEFTNLDDIVMKDGKMYAKLMTSSNPPQYRNVEYTPKHQDYSKNLEKIRGRFKAVFGEEVTKLKARVVEIKGKLKPLEDQVNPDPSSPKDIAAQKRLEEQMKPLKTELEKVEKQIAQFEAFIAAKGHASVGAGTATPPTPSGGPPIPPRNDPSGLTPSRAYVLSEKTMPTVTVSRLRSMIKIVDKATFVLDRILLLGFQGTKEAYAKALKEYEAKDKAARESASPVPQPEPTPPGTPPPETEEAPAIKELQEKERQLADLVDRWIAKAKEEGYEHHEEDLRSELDHLVREFCNIENPTDADYAKLEKSMKSACTMTAEALSNFLGDTSAATDARSSQPPSSGGPKIEDITDNQDLR